MSYFTIAKVHTFENLYYICATFKLHEKHRLHSNRNQTNFIYCFLPCIRLGATLTKYFYLGSLFKACNRVYVMDNIHY